jgi:hypothetical protein
MKKLLLIFFCLPLLSFGQTDFSWKYTGGISGFAYGSIALSDVDNDGDDDVLISGYNYNNDPITELYLNDSLGNFTLVSGTPFTGVYGASIVFSDVDNDGDNDVLITGHSGSFFMARLYLNDGLGNFTLVNGTSFTGVEVGSIGSSDVDNDGDNDVLITGLSNNNISELYLNDGLGNFTLVIGTPFTGVKYSSIAFSDVDNDGDEDVLITGLSNNNIAISELYLNDSLGNFTLDSITPFIGVYLSSIAFSDIDNDGDNDVLITGATGSGATGVSSKLYKNNGLGNFTLVSGTSFVGGSTIDFSDIDNDGDEDVLITGASSKLYVNDGLGNFTLVSGTSFVSVNSSSCAFSDIDNDGDKDVFITGYSSSHGKRVSYLYLNDYFLSGCTDSTANNFNPLAITNDGSCDYATSIIEIGSNKTLLKIINILGQESNPKKNTPLFYIYDDGTVEKRIVIE